MIIRKVKYKFIYVRVAAALIGAIAGYAYYHYIGCVSSTCPITSNPWLTIGYGEFFGALLIPTKSKREPADMTTRNQDSK